jgi:hypothetical protein
VTPAAAEWVRDHVWTQQMRADIRSLADPTVCPCHPAPTYECVTGEHAQCAPVGLPSVTTHIVTRGHHVAQFVEPFVHPTWSAIGPRKVRYAQVWLADRRCRPVCGCDCHTGAATAPELALAGCVQPALF